MGTFQDPADEQIFNEAMDFIVKYRYLMDLHSYSEQDTTLVMVLTSIQNRNQAEVPGHQVDLANMKTCENKCKDLISRLQAHPLVSEYKFTCFKELLLKKIAAAEKQKEENMLVIMREIKEKEARETVSDSPVLGRKQLHEQLKLVLLGKMNIDECGRYDTQRNPSRFAIYPRGAIVARLGHYQFLGAHEPIIDYFLLCIDMVKFIQQHMNNVQLNVEVAKIVLSECSTMRFEKPFNPITFSETMRISIDQLVTDVKEASELAKTLLSEIMQSDRVTAEVSKAPRLVI